MSYGSESYKAMALRRINAEKEFSEQLQRAGALLEPQAHAVMLAYLKFKLASYDGTRITVKHGALFDRETIRTVAKNIGAIEPPREHL